MRKICIVGAGNISKVYTDVLAKQSVEIYYVDPKFPSPGPDRCFRSVAEIPAKLALEFQWIICTPTLSHESAVHEVLKRNPEARLLVEKPIVPLSQFASLLELYRQFPNCRILENCQYRQSSLVDKVLDLAKEHLPSGAKLKSFYVEFTKNRIQDNRLGRFTDPDYLLLGYEGPHMIALAEAFAERLLGRPVLERSPSLTCEDKNVPDATRPDEGSARFRFHTPALPPIDLYTSMIGEVGDDLLMPRKYSEIRRKWIFLRDRDRYRIVRLNFEDFSLVVRFDPQKFLSNGLIRNEQLIYKVKGKAITRIATLHLNIFDDAIACNLERLNTTHYDTRRELERAHRTSKLLDRLTQLYISAPERMTSLDERRQGWRLDAQLKVALTINEKQYHGTVTDLNEGGFQFECADTLPVGVPFTFEIAGKAPHLTGEGTIRWARYFTFEPEKTFCFGCAVQDWKGTTGREVVETLLKDTD